MTGSSLWGFILGDQCKADGDELWGWVLYPLIMLYAFYILARICDGHLTTALEFIVERMNLSEDVAGATFLAMASSAPELFTSIISTFVVVSETGAANIVGSAVFNLLVIIGVVPVFAGNSLRIWWYPTARDAVFYSVSIAELGLVLLDGKVYWWEGFIMLLSYTFYVFYFTQNQKVIEFLGIEEPTRGADEGEEEDAADPEAAPQKTGEDNAKPGGTGKLDRGDTGGTSGSEDKSKKGKNKGWDSGSSQQRASENSEDGGDHSCDLDQDSGRKNSRGNSRKTSIRAQKTTELKMSKVVPIPDETPPPKPKNANQGQAPEIAGREEDQENPPNEAVDEEEEDEGWMKYEPVMFIVNKTMNPFSTQDRVFVLFGACCLWIGVFTYFAVDTGGRLGHCLLKIQDVVMGLVVFAAGTSVPDAMGSIAVAKDGKGDMAVANAVGSNTFDILLGLGLPWFLKGAISGEPIDIPPRLIKEAILILAGCLIFYLVLLHCNRWVLTKRLGCVLLGLYACVIIFILVWYEVEYGDDDVT